VSDVARDPAKPVGPHQTGDEAPSAGAGESAAGLSDDERTRRREALDELMGLMRPAVQADGGDLVLVDADVDAGVVEVMLKGACSSCAISSATLQGGIERILKDRLEWVSEVIGGLDEETDWFESQALGQGGYVPRSL
jgi:Fe-S cluster biogenesis protein NfuA